jgi:hypothetical protein
MSAALLAACTTLPNRSDKVRDADSAIAVAKAACNLSPGQQTGRWTASFADGVWTAWYTEHPNWPATGNRVLVRADTGAADECETIVTAD